MCDVLVAMNDSTRRKKIVFGKNSDRPAGECQVLHYSPGRSSSADGRIECSYLTVPDDVNAQATLGCRPYWCWGYETGMNENGVIGGNAAIFTRSFHDIDNRKNPGLTGMDLLRFGLERGSDAEKAISVIIDLLEKYGQWGSAVRGLEHEKGSYENSFLLVDRKEAWILETSGRRWVAERVKNGIRTISNEPTIRKRWDKASHDIKDYARQSGWWNPCDSEFDFAYVYGDHENYSRQVSHIRWKRTNQLLKLYDGKIDVISMMTILRDHYEDTFLEGSQFHPYLPDFHTICMHDSPAGFTWGNTATSVIVEMDPESSEPPVFWIAYLPPCTSIYSAVPFTGEIPEALSQAGTAGLRVRRPTRTPEDRFAASSLWWRLHRLTGEVRKDPATRYEEMRNLFDRIEKQHVDHVFQILHSDSKTNLSHLNRQLQKHVGQISGALDELEERWQINRSDNSPFKENMR
jgi:secernin